MRDHLFLVQPPFHDGRAWWWTVEGVRRVRHGPYAAEQHALAAQALWMRAWNQRARALGGWLAQQTGTRWIVTLPDAQPCGGLPLEGQLRNPIRHDPGP